MVRQTQDTHLRRYGTRAELSALSITGAHGPRRDVYRIDQAPELGQKSPSPPLVDLSCSDAQRGTGHRFNLSRRRHQCAVKPCDPCCRSCRGPALTSAVRVKRPFLFETDVGRGPAWITPGTWRCQAQREPAAPTSLVRPQLADFNCRYSPTLCGGLRQSLVPARRGHCAGAPPTSCRQLITIFVDLASGFFATVTSSTPSLYPAWILSWLASFGSSNVRRIVP